jgi:hypothetical protein
VLGQENLGARHRLSLERPSFWHGEQLLQPLLGTNAARGAFLPHARQQADRDRMQAIWWKGGAQQLD